MISTPFDKFHNDYLHTKLYFNYHPFKIWLDFYSNISLRPKQYYIIRYTLLWLVAHNFGDGIMAITADTFTKTLKSGYTRIRILQLIQLM